MGGESPSVHRLGALTGRRQRRAPRRFAKSPENWSGSTRSVRTRPILVRPRHPWQSEPRMRSPSSRHLISSPRLTKSKQTWRRPSPWTASSAGTLAGGKTEIAVRAAFKAVQDGKQVAVLVPTTLLVRQHEQTFAARFARSDSLRRSRDFRRPRNRRRCWREFPTAPSTSSSLLTGCCRRRPLQGSRSRHR